MDLKVAHGADTDEGITTLTKVGAVRSLPRMRLRKPTRTPNQVALQPESDLKLVEH